MNFRLSVEELMEHFYLMPNFEFKLFKEKFYW